MLPGAACPGRRQVSRCIRLVAGQPVKRTGRIERVSQGAADPGWLGCNQPESGYYGNGCKSPGQRSARDVNRGRNAFAVWAPSTTFDGALCLCMLALGVDTEPDEGLVKGVAGAISRCFNAG